MQRITGLESEHRLAVLGALTDDQRRLLDDIEIVRLGYVLDRTFALNSDFLPNGGRLYLDGEHPEYSSPECLDLRTLVAQVTTGDRLMTRLASALNTNYGAALRSGGPGSPTLRILKRNTDRRGKPVGTHENYLIPQFVADRRLRQALVPFLVTRQVAAGGGSVRRSDSGVRMALSERAFSIHSEFTTWITEIGLIRSVSEPLADRNQFRRLEILAGDSNRSETAVFFKVGATDLLLRAIEEGWTFQDLTLEDPVRDMTRVSSKGPGIKLTLANGSRRTAAEIQGMYLERLTHFAQLHQLDRDPEVRQVLEFWERSLRAVTSDGLGLVEREVDWLMKRRALDDDGLREWMYELIDADGLRSQAGRLLEPEDIVDSLYADVSPNSLYAEMDRRGLVQHIVSPAELEAAEHTPPHDTRAAIRGQAAAMSSDDVIVHWDALYFPRFTGGAYFSEQHEVALLDPHQQVSLSVESMLEATRDAHRSDALPASRRMLSGGGARRR